MAHVPRRRHRFSQPQHYSKMAGEGIRGGEWRSAAAGLLANVPSDDHVNNVGSNKNTVM
uniref:Uncharacterized protein n=1 Tax=Oryza sativa subsp. japonica TaxID=39947 RepID=Q6EN64_ORYSJ|nr:hypothetical protein [Oryza sativa Japonica Group]BAD29671.1 hypothetical protein [Oryza sativa Japonica Group]